MTSHKIVHNLANDRKEGKSLKETKNYTKVGDETMLIFSHAL